MTTTNNLPARLKQLRQAAGLTQEQLARNANVGLSFVTKLERGAIISPRLDKAALLAVALGCTVDDMLQPATSTNRRNAK